VNADLSLTGASVSRNFSAPLVTHPHDKKNLAAFTLIELLVVITIIAILASIAFPVFNTVTERANQTKDLSNIRQVGVALKLFASDHEGSFPVTKDPDTAGGAAITTANQAFRELLPNYLTNEEIFAVKGSAYTKSVPDNRIDQTPSGGNYTQTLKADENSYSYVTNLTETSNSAFPVMADGFVDPVGSPPANSTDKTQKGGVWAAKREIVLNCDGSVNNFICDPTSKTPTHTGNSGQKVSIFDTSDPTNWLGATNLAVNPE
jgi:prepilin-type N-terminal cleavage/methylation domain-containing protein